MPKAAIGHLLPNADVQFAASNFFVCKKEGRAD